MGLFQLVRNLISPEKPDTIYCYYAQQTLPKNNFPSIFLAGPTPRDAATKSWRPDAIQLLKHSLKGNLFIPEGEKEVLSPKYENQIAWEEAALKKAKVILFWIPRSLPAMPGFTTNIEFGTWMYSNKVVLGIPPNAPHCSYILYYANKLKIPTAHNLQDTVTLALQKLANTK